MSDIRYGRLSTEDYVGTATVDPDRRHVSLLKFSASISTTGPGMYGYHRLKAKLQSSWAVRTWTLEIQGSLEARVWSFFILSFRLTLHYGLHYGLFYRLVISESGPTRIETRLPYSNLLLFQDTRLFKLLFCIFGICVIDFDRYIMLINAWFLLNWEGNCTSSKHTISW